MAFDYKKEYRRLYQPKDRPEIVDVPPANYIAVRGQGDPNRTDGAYQRAVRILYAVAYTVRMGGKDIPGYFEFVVPPLEGLWWQDDVDGVDYGNKAAFHWISIIRLPDFVTEESFRVARAQASVKKKLDCSPAEFLPLREGLCVQMLHMGSFDGEPETVSAMNAYLAENGYETDIRSDRLHHEIYLTDGRKTPPEKQKTVIRHPIRKL